MVRQKNVFVERSWYFSGRMMEELFFLGAVLLLKSRQVAGKSNNQWKWGESVRCFLRRYGAQNFSGKTPINWRKWGTSAEDYFADGKKKVFIF